MPLGECSVRTKPSEKKPLRSFLVRDYTLNDTYKSNYLQVKSLLSTDDELIRDRGYLEAIYPTLSFI